MKEIIHKKRGDLKQVGLFLHSRLFGSVELCDGSDIESRG